MANAFGTVSNPGQLRKLCSTWPFQANTLYLFVINYAKNVLVIFNISDQRWFESISKIQQKISQPSEEPCHRRAQSIVWKITSKFNLSTEEIKQEN